MRFAERDEAAVIVLFEHGIAEQARDAQRSRFALGPREPAVMRGCEDRIVAALQMLHRIRPLASQFGKRRTIPDARQCIHHVGIAVAHVFASAGASARNLARSSSSTYSSPRSSG